MFLFTECSLVPEPLHSGTMSNVHPRLHPFHEWTENPTHNDSYLTTNILHSLIQIGTILILFFSSFFFLPKKDIHYCFYSPNP